MADGDEYDEDLPEISVLNTSSQNCSQFKMPSAVEIASQRAREEECEREIIQLREEYHILMHSDSSGSEGEASLTAGINCLKVQNTSSNLYSPPDTKETIVSLIESCTNFNIDAKFLESYLLNLQNLDEYNAMQFTEKLIDSISSLLICSENMWTDSDAVSVGSWLCAASVWAKPAVSGARIRQPLSCLLQAVFDDKQMKILCCVLLHTFRAARARLELSDVLRGGCGSGRGDKMATIIVTRAIKDLLVGLSDGDTELCCEVTVSEVSGWVTSSWAAARLSPNDQYCAVQLISRFLCHTALRPGEKETMNAMISFMTQPLKLADKKKPEILRVMVAASKLQLLFRDKE